MKKILANTGVQVLGKMVGIVVGLVTTGLLTRSLGTRVYGDFLLIQSLALVVQSLSSMGTEVIGVREISRRGDKVLGSLVILRKILGGIAVGVMVGMAWIWTPLREIRGAVMIAGLSLIVVSFLGDLGIWFQTRLKMGWKTLVETLVPVLFLGFLVAGERKGSLVGVMTGYLVARMIAVVVGWKLAWREGWRELFFKKIEASWSQMRKLMKMSWPMGVYLLLFTSYDKMIDSVMIRQFLGRESVAWYGLAYKIYSNLNMPAYFLVSSVFPLLSSSEKKKESKELMLRGLVILLGLVAVGLPLTWWLAPMAIKIMGGAGFEPGITVLRILSLAFSLAYVNHMLGFGIVAQKGQNKILGYGIGAAVFNLAANFLVIPIWGIKGAAGVTVATEGLMMIMMSRFYRKE
jgi:O-antigen/teichoic acid export membrane protein